MRPERKLQPVVHEGGEREQDPRGEVAGDDEEGVARTHFGVAQVRQRKDQRGDHRQRHRVARPQAEALQQVAAKE